MALRSVGLGLSEAHAVLNRIVADETVPVTLRGASAAEIVDRLAALGVAAEAGQRS